MNRRHFLRVTAAGAIALAAPSIPFGENVVELGPAPASVINLPVPMFLKGDIISFEGVFAINPITMRETEFLQQFVITADVAEGTFPQLSPMR